MSNYACLSTFNYMPFKYKAKKFGQALKIVGKLGLEIGKRAVSPSYYKQQVINPTLKKRK